MALGLVAYLTVGPLMPVGRLRVISKLSEQLQCDPSHLNLIVRVIRKAPEVRPTVMTPELLEMAAEAAKIREIVAEEREAPRKFLSQPRRAPFTQEFPRYELPYPKVKY